MVLHFSCQFFIVFSLIVRNASFSEICFISVAAGFLFALFNVISASSLPVMPQWPGNHINAIFYFVFVKLYVYCEFFCENFIFFREFVFRNLYCSMRITDYTSFFFFIYCRVDCGNYRNCFKGENGDVFLIFVYYFCVFRDWSYA